MGKVTKMAFFVGVLWAASLVLAACAPFGWGSGWIGSGRSFRSNGEQLYFTATSQRNTPITSDMGMGMMGGMVACADCHGSDGRGGQVQMMMRRFTAPDIRYSTLISGEMEHGDEGHGGEEEEHRPYAEETLKRAIRQGVNPAGEPLDWPMPRWQMSDEDMNDLIGFLKTLE